VISSLIEVALTKKEIFTPEQTTTIENISKLYSVINLTLDTFLENSTFEDLYTFTLIMLNNCSAFEKILERLLALLSDLEKTFQKTEESNSNPTTNKIPIEQKKHFWCVVVKINEGIKTFKGGLSVELLGKLKDFYSSVLKMKKELRLSKKRSSLIQTNYDIVLMSIISKCSQG